jgi:hypothetical protein
MAFTTAATDHGLHSVAITDYVEYVSRRLARTWSTIAVAVFLVPGLIEVTDTGQIIVRLSGLDWTGARIVEYSFPIVAPDTSP